MAKEDVLGSVRVASPCSASWERMEGDERTRHCESCKLNVYNLSGMSRKEAETLVSQSQGHVCVRFYRRPDGTMLTQNCPVGVMAIRKRMATTLACTTVLFLTLYSYASTLAHREPIDANSEAQPFSAYEKARSIEPIRILLDRLYPPPPSPRQFTMGSPAGPPVPTK